MRLLLLSALFILGTDLLGQQLNSIGVDLPYADSLLRFPDENLDSARQAFFHEADGLKSDHKSGLAILKKRYLGENILGEVPKKRPNEMRDGAFIERVRPGVTMQFFGKGNKIQVDLNPYVGYLTGKLTAGLGWTHRIAFYAKQMWFTNNSPMFGPRAFCDFKIGKGFSPRAEFEYMNTLIPPTILKINSEIKYSQWVPGAFVGMKKEYQLFRDVKGTGMVMFRLFNPDHKSPYADVINIRVGFEFPLKKKPEQLQPDSQ
jgi:hypothetical protein